VTAHAGGNVKKLTIDVFDSARDAIGHVLEGEASSASSLRQAPFPS